MFLSYWNSQFGWASFYITAWEPGNIRSLNLTNPESKYFQCRTKVLWYFGIQIPYLTKYSCIADLSFLLISVCRHLGWHACVTFSVNISGYKSMQWTDQSIIDNLARRWTVRTIVIWNIASCLLRSRFLKGFVYRYAHQSFKKYSF